MGGGTAAFHRAAAGTDPPSTDLADLNDGAFHTFGLEWSDTAMTCTLDGTPYHTFTENIPTDPVDMMLMLTLEFKPDLWVGEHGDQGDGRTEGPFVSDTPERRVMSEVLVDHVRVYHMKPAAGR